MTRLDTEFDLEAAHELLDINRDVRPGAPEFWSLCSCGWPSERCDTRRRARRLHELHQADALGVGDIRERQGTRWQG